jgi:hypothetical protein
VAACGDAALAVNGGGAGPVSAEWMVPKALWLKQRERATYDAAAHICEYQARAASSARRMLFFRFIRVFAVFAHTPCALALQPNRTTSTSS